MTEALTRLELPRLTIDVDGSVIRTGATVGWAFRGFNPHHRKDPSYYPLFAHVAQTGHILRLKNRPGNVHDSKQAVAFLRELIDDLRARFGRRVALEFRMDAAFFQRGILQPARRPGLWLRDQGRLLELAAAQGDRRRVPPLEPVAPGVTGHETELVIPQWQDLRLRVVLYRKHVHHQTRRNFQLDLFTPDDGHYEYSAVATNLPLGLPALWAFACGRGAQEKTFAELKGEFALDVVPTKHYAANSAWQQLEHPRPQPDPELPAGHPRGAEAAVAEADLRVPVPQHAHAPVPPHRPGRAPDPTRRPERAPPDQEPRDGDAVWADR